MPEECSRGFVWLSQQNEGKLIEAIAKMPVILDVLSFEKASSETTWVNVFSCVANMVAKDRSLSSVTR